MIEFKFTTYKTHNIIELIADQLKLELEHDCLEKKLVLPKKYGTGSIICFTFGNGIDLLLFSANIKQSWTFIFDTEHPPSLLFNTCIKGTVYHTMNNRAISYQLKEMEASITADQLSHEQMFRIPPNQKNDFIILLMDRAAYLENLPCLLTDVPLRIQTIMEDQAAKSLFFYTGHYSVLAFQECQTLLKDENTNIVRSIFVEGKTLSLLSQLVKQYRDDLQPNLKQTTFRQNDIDSILMARDILVNNLHNPPTIIELSKIIGLNQTKLKTGFKKILDTSIKQYIIKERLELAKLLILKEEMSIQNIAFKIGYSNQSYFARLFKKEFGMLPSKFAIAMRDKYNINDSHLSMQKKSIRTI